MMRAILRLGSRRSTEKLRLGRSKPVVTTTRIDQAEQLDHLGAHSLGCRGGEGDHGRANGKRRDERSDAQIRRPEILTPLRHAVSLVDGDQGYRRPRGELLEPRILEPLGATYITS